MFKHCSAVRLGYIHEYPCISRLYYGYWLLPPWDALCRKLSSYQTWITRQEANHHHGGAVSRMTLINGGSMASDSGFFALLLGTCHRDNMGQLWEVYRIPNEPLDFCGGYLIPWQNCMFLPAQSPKLCLENWKGCLTPLLTHRIPLTYRYRKGYIYILYIYIYILYIYIYIYIYIYTYCNRWWIKCCAPPVYKPK